MCESCLTTSYDILGQVISVLDVTTDIIVCVGFYQKDRMIFFGISLTILCLALIAYDMAFVMRYSREEHGGHFALFVCLLPITPLIPFIFYFTNTNHKPLSKFLQNHCCFEIRMDAPYIPDDASKLRKFMEEKISKHLGFILEALVEAFPQAILQMIAIVIYSEANIIAIVSILLSMLSMASKSFVFSIAVASNMKQLIWNWLCAITDFLSIFVTVSWVFFTPHSDHLSDAFALIRMIWLYKLYICVFPLIGVVSIGIHVSGMYEAIYNIRRKVDNVYVQLCGSICAFVMICFFWVCGIIASVLVLEILTWTWLAGTFWVLGTDRFTNNKTSLEFWFTLVGWINSAKTHRVGTIYKGCVSFTKQQDRMMRLCCLNEILLKHITFPRDKVLESYLTKKKKENQYMTVTMSDIRSNTKDIKKSQLIRKFWRRLYGALWKEICDLYRDATHREDSIRWGFLKFGIGIVTFILGPIYALSRFMTLFFPGFIIIYLYFKYDVNIWNTMFVDRFQVVMISIYLILCVIVSMLFYLNCCEQFLMAHILPAEDWIFCIYNGTETQQVIKSITNHYFGIIVIPMRRAIVIERFGPDLGKVILSYLPIDDEYDNANHDVVTPKIVI